MESFFRTPESKMNNATTRSKIVWTMNNMTGDTKEWKYDRNRVWDSPAPNGDANRSYPTWENFKTEFLERFSPEEDEDKALNQLLSLTKKRASKDVIGYMGKFDTLLSRSGIVGEKQKMNYFVKGLPDLYQQAIIVSGTTTYTAAKQKVRDIKMGRDRLGIDREEKDPNAMDVDRTRINAVKAGPGDECFYCQKKGHWAKDC